MGENLTCVTHKFRKLHSLKMGDIISGIDLHRLNQENLHHWIILVQRHLPNVFQDFPRCLTLINENRIVAETCSDAHETDYIQLDFLYDTTTIVEQYIVAMLLTASLSLQNDMQHRIYQGIMNPITQVYFTQQELDFFVRVYVKTETSKTMQHIQRISNVLKMPIMEEFVGSNISCLASITSHSVYWTNLSKPKKVVPIAILIHALQNSLGILKQAQQEEKSSPNTLLKIWNQLDLEPVSNDILFVRELSHETIKTLFGLFQILIQMVPLLGILIEDSFFETIKNVLITISETGVLCLDSFLGIIFKYVVPFKESELENVRKEPFVPGLHFQYHALETLRTQIWTKLNHDTFEDVNEAIHATRIAFRLVFRNYMLDNLDRLSHDASDIYFDICLMYDIDCVEIKYQKTIRRPILQLNRFGNFVLLKPLY